MTYGTFRLDRTSPETLISTCDGYLASRDGHYEWRCVRYDMALQALSRLYEAQWKATRELTICDVGAGWTEFGRRMFERGWQSRYWPVDGSLDGTDLETWVPPRTVDAFVALEILEHLEYPWRLVRAMQAKADAIVITTPNPRTTDVLGMDATHQSVITAARLAAHGFTVDEVPLYGTEADSLLGVWERFVWRSYELPR